MAKEIVLGLDTALQTCAASLLVGETLVAHKVLPMEKGHAEHIAPLADALFREAEIGPQDLTRIGVVVGPGGFTGLRVGLAFARALALGAAADVVGVTSLEALYYGAARRAARPVAIAPVIDARRDQLFGAFYGADGAERTPPFVSSPKEAMEILRHGACSEDVYVVGSGGALLPTLPENWRIDGESTQIDPADVARIALRAPLPTAPPRPLYLRPPDARPPAATSVFKGLLTSD
ncbi:MAG: tRNA (adenosine(37)-N6)-threonylcarbamoyltransferase complex dimerization subunit type 1 TsaB [Pseudomonadota bacterium]